MRVEIDVLGFMAINRPNRVAYAMHALAYMVKRRSASGGCLGS